MAKVSILLPVFNGARHLSAAIESVLAQTFEDWQLIVCDDQSTDDSSKIIARYAGQDKRIRSFTNAQNLGLFENYNECLRLSGASAGQCQYVKPFAQDDILHPQALEKLVEVLEQQRDVALVSCARSWIGDDGMVTGSVRPFPTSRKIKGADVILYNLIQLTNWVGEPSTVMFRAEKAGEGFDALLFHYGDVDYWFRIVSDSFYFYLNETLCSFRRHSNSTTSKNLSGLYFAADIFRMGKKYRNYLEEIGESEEHFFRRAVETAALNVDHLVRGEGLTVDRMIASKRIELGQAPERSNNSETAAVPCDGPIDCTPESVRHAARLDREDAFREVAFHSLRYVTDLLYAYSDLQHRTDAEKAHLEKQLSDMKTSTSWKITAPLRTIMRGGQETP